MSRILSHHLISCLSNRHLFSWFHYGALPSLIPSPMMDIITDNFWLEPSSPSPTTLAVSHGTTTPGDFDGQDFYLSPSAIPDGNTPFSTEWAPIAADSWTESASAITGNDSSCTPIAYSLQVDPSPSFRSASEVSCPLCYPSKPSSSLIAERRLWTTAVEHTSRYISTQHKHGIGIRYRHNTFLPRWLP